MLSLVLQVGWRARRRRSLRPRGNRLSGGTAGRHTHPGIETGYILEGEADLLIDGKPPQHLKAGDSYQIPAGAVHDAKVSGDKALKVLGIYVVDKTKPLASPAP